MKIYTKTGDAGSTGLLGGQRVSKASLRVAAYGAVDETNAALGWVRVIGLPEGLDAFLARLQDAAFRLGAALAAAPGVDPRVVPLADADVGAIEATIDRLEATLPPLKTFVLPGGGEAGARLHVVRTVARRAERAIVALAEVEAVDAVVLRWINRLSDLLFVAARAANAREGVPDVPWKPGT
jgi:cob(I)alamin adenosyltransferase